MTTGADWQTLVGDVWAAEWRRTDRSFADLSPRLDGAIVAAAPASVGRAVDLGCGAGQTSITLARARPDLMITGVDISPELLRVAQSRAAGLPPRLRFVRSDAARDAADVAAGAHLIFSRHGVMFYDRPHSVFTDLRRAVAPDARLVFSCFRAAAQNGWASELVTTVTGAAPLAPNGYAPGPFGFADAGWTKAMLESAGWTNVGCEPVDYSYVAGEGEDPITDAVGFLRRIGPVAAALRAIPEAARPAALDRLAAALAQHRSGDRVAFPAAAWLWRAAAR